MQFSLLFNQTTHALSVEFGSSEKRIEIELAHSLTEDVNFPLKFSKTDQELQIGFESNDMLFDLSFANFQEFTVDPNIEYYEGSCDVIPSVDCQVLETAQKFVPYDVTIQPIPYFDVSNTKGGSTVYIGTAAEMSITH